jgi:nucleoside diphosphate kinase
MSQVINVGTIHEEILKKGLEMSEFKYMKSMQVFQNDKFYDESRAAFEDELNSFFKN